MNIPSGHRVVVLTSDRRNWLLKGFLHQWQKYDGRPIEIAGFTDPGPAVRGETPFVSIGPFSRYPVTHWSNAVMAYLQGIQDDLVEIWLEDYWLMRPSNHALIDLAQLYMMQRENADVLRFDLITDRMYAQNARPAGFFGPMDLVEAKGQYSLSYQVNIWNRRHLLEMLVPYESPWESELNGTQRVNESIYRVIGSKQCPVLYMIVVNKGQVDRSGSWMMPARTLSVDDWEELDRLGYVTP